MKLKQELQDPIEGVGILLMVKILTVVLVRIPLLALIGKIFFPETSGFPSGIIFIEIPSFCSSRCYANGRGKSDYGR